MSFVQLEFPRDGDAAPDATVSAKKIAAALEPFYHSNRAAFKLVVERGPLIDELTLASERASCGWFVAVLREAKDILVCAMHACMHGLHVCRTGCPCFFFLFSLFSLGCTPTPTPPSYTPHVCCVFGHARTWPC